MATKDLLKEAQNYTDLDLDMPALLADQKRKAVDPHHKYAVSQTWNQKETDKYGHFPQAEDGEPMMGAEWDVDRILSAEEKDARLDVDKRQMVHAVIRFQNQREIEVVETPAEIKTAMEAGKVFEVHQLHVEIKRKFPTPVDTVVEKEVTQIAQLVNPQFVQVVADTLVRPVHTNNHAHMDAVTGPFSKM